MKNMLRKRNHYVILFARNEVIILEIKDYIKERRLNLGLTLEQVGNHVGVGKSTVKKWESGFISNIGRDKIAKLAEILRISPLDIIYDNIETPHDIYLVDKCLNITQKTVAINVFGRIAAGISIEAADNVIDTEEISEELAKTGAFFGLQIQGDSMEPRICDGDVVIVRQQEYAESGDIIIATVNGADATCRRLRKYRDGIELISNNPSYEPSFFSKEDIETKPVKIIGKVVELRAKF